jgi:NAD(P)H-flavin reductase
MSLDMLNLPQPTVIADAMVPQIFQVHHHQWETHDVFTLALKAVNTDQPFHFAPGQFNMLYAFGVGEAAISISGDPHQSEYLIHTIRSVGNVTQALSRLQPGDALGVRGPFGQAWPMATAIGQDVILIAGGIGIAPLRPVIYQVLAQREKYGQVVIVFGTRTPKDLIFAAEFQRWRSRFDLQGLVTVSAAESAWRGNVGVVTNLLKRAEFDSSKAIAMICGPEIMMKFAILELSKLGMAAESMYVTMERNMKCAIGFCGHCQLGPNFICKDGPVFRYDQMRFWLEQREV